MQTRVKSTIERASKSSLNSNVPAANVGVAVAVGVSEGVAVCVGVDVAVGVSVGVGEGPNVGDGVMVGVSVGVLVAVGVDVGTRLVSITSWGGFAPSRLERLNEVLVVVVSPRLIRPLPVMSGVISTVLQVPATNEPDVPYTLLPTAGAVE